MDGTRAVRTVATGVYRGALTVDRSIWKLAIWKLAIWKLAIWNLEHARDLLRAWGFAGLMRYLFCGVAEMPLPKCPAAMYHPVAIRNRKGTCR